MREYFPIEYEIGPVQIQLDMYFVHGQNRIYRQCRHVFMMKTFAYVKTFPVAIVFYTQNDNKQINFFELSYLIRFFFS